MKIVILGSGAFSREVYDWVTQAGYQVVGFFNGRTSPETSLRGLPIFYEAEKIPKDAQWIVGSGNPKAMVDMIEKVRGHISACPAVVHPSCVVGSNVNIGEGSIVCPGSVLTCDIEIGKSVVVNIGCTIGHDVRLGDYVHLSPNTSLSGFVAIGSYCEIGTGVSVVPSVKIADRVIVGAGGSVVKSLVEAGTYVGVPAKLKA
ncbi:hypothetical protein AZI86_10940 [Bdellovibrio bacteriovorus]|uniref:PglD N-terminal domain-containing protein n=1 Tax=Bdellovibrio bacteriovorus TaxID=959 RepID=A0A150WLA8_BDEBC|nr:NeuD/PglB/VioB family sugar acetyltransferase [Bdellovibrio bacteriovorus]KYG64718.1 hypothetical protein AZI86_10940 [Bdellovibrio bacteriovorus]